jgi:hypothetical protein
MGSTELAAAVAGARERFARQAACPAQAQQALLQSILSRHRGSRFARDHGFDRVAARCAAPASTLHEGLAAWRDAVPPADHAGFAPAIDAMAAGAQRVLVDEPVVAFERTGGSTGGAKLVPLTASGLDLLRQGLFAWIDDLCLHRPGAMQGTSYWSISPAARAPGRTAGGEPIGLASDAEYFGDAAAAIGAMLCVPPAIGSVADIGAWRSATLRCLLADARLSLVSVWSPTFWTELCRHAVEQRERLVDAIARGGWPVPAPGSPADAFDDAFGAAFGDALPGPHPDPVRARVVDAALRAPQPDWARIWPRLALLSCWTHGSAAAWVPGLAAAFPGVEIQGKGLLATEAIVSLPLCDGGDPVAAVGSTVIEFEDDAGRCFNCHEVAQGGEYAVLVTTSAGLYRYRLGDRVQVTGHWQRTPRLRLLGRGAASSDLCGEKLDEAFVLGCARALPVGAMRLVPVRCPAPHYRLVLDAAECGEAEAGRIAQRLDERLSVNPQYAYARRIGQLGAIVACRVDRLAARLQALALMNGQRLGDAKPGALGRIDEPDLQAVEGVAR